MIWETFKKLELALLPQSHQPLQRGHQCSPRALISDSRQLGRRDRGAGRHAQQFLCLCIKVLCSPNPPKLGATLFPLQRLGEEGKSFGHESHAGRQQSPESTPQTVPGGTAFIEVRRGRSMGGPHTPNFSTAPSPPPRPLLASPTLLPRDG